MMIYRSALVSVFSSWQCCEKTFLVVWNRIADSQEDGSHDGSIVHKFLLGSKFLSLGIHILLHACYFFLLCPQHPFSLIKLFLSPFLQMGRERQKKSMFLTPFLSLNCQMVINWNIRWELNLRCLCRSGRKGRSRAGWSHCLGFFELLELILTTSKTAYVCKYSLTLFISQCINCLLHKTQNRELVVLQIHNTTLLKFHKISSFSPKTTSFCNTGGIYYNSCCFCNGVEYEFNSLSIPSGFQKLAQ